MLDLHLSPFPVLDGDAELPVLLPGWDGAQAVPGGSALLWDEPVPPAQQQCLSPGTAPRGAAPLPPAGRSLMGLCWSVLSLPQPQALVPCAAVLGQLCLREWTG